MEQRVMCPRFRRADEKYRVPFLPIPDFSGSIHLCSVTERDREERKGRFARWNGILSA